MLNEVYEKCTEFCALIYHRDKELQARIDSLMEIIDFGEDSYGVEDNIADQIEKRLEKVWELITDEEHEENHELSCVYFEIMEEISRHYERPLADPYQQCVCVSDDEFYEYADNYDFDTEEAEEEELEDEECEC